jgi:hypothetical protein
MNKRTFISTSCTVLALLATVALKLQPAFGTGHCEVPTAVGECNSPNHAADCEKAINKICITFDNESCGRADTYGETAKTVKQCVGPFEWSQEECFYTTKENWCLTTQDYICDDSRVEFECGLDLEGKWVIGVGLKAGQKGHSCKRKGTGRARTTGTWYSAELAILLPPK